MTSTSKDPILVVAYACEPGKGSEPGAGWQWVSKISELGPVVLLTSSSGRSDLEREVARLRNNIDVRRVSTPFDFVDFDSRLRYLRYGSWIVCAGITARRLERGGLRVAHHVTYATDWLPSPCSWLRSTPYIWGPVGGSTYAPRALLKQFGVKERLANFSRKVIGTILRQTAAARTKKRASLIVALNSDTARSFKSYPTTIECNAALNYSDVEAGATSSRSKVLIYAGRLVAWKGARLAVRAMQDPRLSDWTLEIHGDGPERQSLEALVAKLCLGNRVRIIGWTPRKDVIERVRSASILVFPSIHDSAPWSVAEAAGVGTIVLGFPIGGAPVLAGPNFRQLDVQRPIESIAEAILEHSNTTHTYSTFREFSEDRIPRVVGSWYEAAELEWRKLKC